VPIAHVWADCLAHKPTESVITVDQCDVIVPEAEPRLKAFAENYRKSFVESGRAEAERTVARILDSYRGAILVQQRDGVAERIFFSSKDPKVCSTLRKRAKIRVLINDACCDGDPNPPCYLGLTAYIEKLLPL
jgi:hypothetical protein